MGDPALAQVGGHGQQHPEERPVLQHLRGPGPRPVPRGTDPDLERRCLYAGTIRGYDLRRPEDPNVLTPDEAWCSRIIGSRMTRSERDELSRRAAQPRGPMGDVRADADLADADPLAPRRGFHHPRELCSDIPIPDP